mgnify:CR=1 FL=1
MQNNFQEKIKLKQQIEFLENTAKTYLDSTALQRYGSLKIAHPEKALQVAATIAQASQQGLIKQKLNDLEFKDLLKSLQEPKKEFRFIRK